MTRTEQKASEITRWSAHPARSRPGAAIATIAVIAALSICAAWLGGSYWWGLAAAVILMLGLNRFFFASTFIIDEAGIEARYLLRKLRLEWKDIRRFLHDSSGGYLSTRSRPSRFDAYRGMYLLFSDDRKKVIALIESKVDSTRVFLAPGKDSSDPASAGGVL